MEKVWSDFLLVFWSNNTRVIENPYCHYCDWLMSVLCYGEKHALSQRKCWTMWAFELCARWCWKESWITTTVCVKCLRNILILQYIYHFVFDFFVLFFYADEYTIQPTVTKETPTSCLNTREFKGCHGSQWFQRYFSAVILPFLNGTVCSFTRVPFDAADFYY